MKKILLSLVAVAITFATAQAQETKFGVKAGINLANLGTDSENYNMKIGFHIGGVANLRITDFFALAPEVIYSVQGAKQDETSFMGFTIPEAKLNLSYLNIPILAKVYLTDGFNIHAGPYMGFLLGAKLKMEDVEQDVKEELKSTDFGVAAGLGYDLPSGLNFGARYKAGLANIAAEEEGSTEDSKTSNSVIQVYAGFNF